MLTRLVMVALSRGLCRFVADAAFFSECWRTTGSRQAMRRACFRVSGKYFVVAKARLVRPLTSRGGLAAAVRSSADHPC